MTPDHPRAGRPPAPGFVIRGYHSADLEACRALWVELTQWHRDLYGSPEIGGREPGLQFDEHLERVGAEHLWVAEADARPVGLAGLIPDPGSEELEPVIVAATHRGRGVGSALAATVIDFARRAGVRQLKVRPVARNGRAVGFFHGCGFGTLGHIELLMDLNVDGDRPFKPGERLAGIDFLS